MIKTLIIPAQVWRDKRANRRQAVSLPEEVNYGRHHRNRKLTPEDVKNIRLFHNLGASYRDMATIHGVHTSTIAKICKFQTYKELK